MYKKLNIEGAQVLGKSDQKEINGSGLPNSCSTFRGGCFRFGFDCPEIECRPWNEQ